MAEAGTELEPPDLGDWEFNALYPYGALLDTEQASDLPSAQPKNDVRVTGVALRPPESAAGQDTAP